MKNLIVPNLWVNTRVRLYILCLSLFTLHSSFFIPLFAGAQNVAINATGNQADPSAMLDVNSTTAGVLIPRMNTTQRNAISSPAIGLQIFNTDCNEMNYWTGNCWISTGSILKPGPITSNSSTALCASVTATYSVTAVTGATGYVWQVPAGAIINSGQGTTSISVTWGNYSGEVCVDDYDACESSDQRCLDINVSPIPPTPGNITGLASVNPGQNLVTYFIASVTGAGVYNWSVPSGASITAGVGTPAITVDYSCSAVSGNVSVTAGSNCGTSSPAALFVTVIPLTVNAGSAAFSGVPIGGSPTASGGQTPYTYSWSPNSNLSSSTVANPTALCSGSTTTYTVNVTDFNGCSATSSVTVTRNLTASAGSAVFGGVAIGGGPTASGGQTPYTYSWNPNSSLSSYSVANPTAQCSGSTTTYTVTVTDAHGCTESSSAIVTRNLTASAGSNATICLGNSTSIGGSPTASGGNSSPYTYSWNPSTNLSSSATANPTANPTSSTTYTITVADANGCTATSSMALTVNSAPAAAGSISGTNSVCQGTNGVSFSVGTITNATGYVWTYTGSGFSIASGNNTNSITANFSNSATSGNLTVYGTNPGCNNGATSATYSITINSSSHGSQTFTATSSGRSGTIQSFTVPSCISSLTIEADGAQGGSSSSASGGLGARMIGTFTVTPGATFNILVGQQGTQGSYNGGGGGGGSFVTTNSNSPLIIAGGGGGAASSSNGNSGLTTTSGGATSGGVESGGAGSNGGGGGGATSYGSAGGGGLLGNGGNCSYGSYGANGGAGGNGTNGGNATAGTIVNNSGGQSFINGGAGGTGTGYTGGSLGDGGFGGGGAGGSGNYPGGGGGGYSGGGGTGWDGNDHLGGGGGSYNIGTNPNNTSGVQSGNGKVIITY